MRQSPTRFHEPLARIRRGIRALRAFVLDTLILTLVRKGSDSGTVLVLRLDAIGDFIIWTEAARALRNVYRERKVVLLANKAWADWVRSFSIFSEVWSLDRTRFLSESAYRWSIQRRVRSAGFSVVVSPSVEREFLVADSLTRVTSAQTRIGVLPAAESPRPPFDWISDRWYNRLVSLGPTEVSELCLNAEFVRQLGASPFRARTPSIPVTPGELPLELLGCEYYVLFPGASWSGRRWPVERFADLAKKIHDAKGWSGVVCGSDGERTLGSALIELAGVPIQNLCGLTSLPQLAVVVQYSKILVGNETSGVHLATAVGTPSVCITGGGHWGRFLPYKKELEDGRVVPLPAAFPMECFACDWNCLFEVAEGMPVPCIDNLTVDGVWHCVRKLIALVDQSDDIS